MDRPGLADQQLLINISAVWALDEALKTCQDRLTIGTSGARERESSNLALSTRLNGHGEFALISRHKINPNRLI